MTDTVDPPPDGAASTPEPAAAALPPSHLANISSVPPLFSQLSLTLDCANLSGTAHGLLKPNPYVEVIVDGKPAKRSDVCKSTYQPRWRDAGPLTLLVTPYSKILFRLFDRSVLKKDSLLGEHTLDLFTLLRRHNGKLERTPLSLDLQHAAKGHLANAQVKVGELVVNLDGLKVDIGSFPASNPVGVSVVPNEVNGNGEVPSGSNGTRSRGSSSSLRSQPPPRPAPPAAAAAATPLTNGAASASAAGPSSNGIRSKSGKSRSKLPALSKKNSSPSPNSAGKKSNMSPKNVSPE